MKIIFTYCLFNIITCFSQAHAQNTDLLLNCNDNNTVKANVQKINLLLDIAWEAQYYNADSTILIAQQAFTLSNDLEKKSRNKKIKNKFLQLKSVAINIGGTGYYCKGNFSKALEHYFKSLKIDELQNNISGITSNIGNIGNIYSNQGKYELALHYYFKGLKINESQKNKTGQASFLGNIGNIYIAKKEFTKALYYYNNALKTDLLLKNENGVSGHYGNIGIVYLGFADSVLAHGNNADAIEKYFPLALSYYQKAFELKEKIGNKIGSAIWSGNIGVVYLRSGNFSQAEKFLLLSLNIANEIESLDDIKLAHKNLSTLFDTTGRFEKALAHYKSYISSRDSITNEENTKKQTQLEMQYEFDKIQTADSIKTAERTNQENFKHNQEIKQQKIYTYGGIIGFGLMLIVALVSFRAFKNKQKANKLIAQQKLLVEEKQKEVMDSIRYAKRIQTALLPSHKYLHRHLSKHQKNNQ